MNTQPKHDLETGDPRGFEEIVAKPDDVSIGDIPNADTATDDLRGHEPSALSDAEADNTRKFVGAAAVAVLIGGLAIVSYATGMWYSAPPALAHRMAATVPAALPAVELAVVAPPQQTIVPPATPIRAAAPVEAVGTPVPAHVTKRQAVHASPKPALAPPEITSPETPPEPVMNTTLTPEPPVPVQISPAQPALPELSLPDLPTAPPPQVVPPPQ